MPETVTVTLSPETWRAVEELACREGISQDELVARAVREHLFLRRFRLLREQLAPHAEAQGVVTDQDVLDRVS